MVNRQTLSDPAPDLRGGDIDRGNDGRPANQGGARSGFPRPGKDHDPGKPGNLGGLPPAIQVAGRIGAKQHDPSLARLPGPESPQRIHRIAGSRPVQFNRLAGESGLAGNRQLNHAGAVLDWGSMPLLERLLPGDNEPDFGEAELIQEGMGRGQVPIMDGIETSAQQPDH